MLEFAYKNLLFAGRVAWTTKNGPRSIIVNTFQPCWLDDFHQDRSDRVEKVLRDNFKEWLADGSRFRGVDGTANFKVYDTDRGLDVVVTAASTGGLFDGAGRASACARVAWEIRAHLRLVPLVEDNAGDIDYDRPLEV